MSEPGANQPHDKLFKWAFTDLATAVAVFRAFLPEHITRHMDLATAELQPGSYIDEEFRAKESDLLYRIRLRERPAFVYILFAHQTTADPWLALRLLGYQVRIWHDFLRAHPGEPALPVIVPLVLAQNKRRWTRSPWFSALFQLGEEEKADYWDCIPEFMFRVIELARIPFDKIAGTPLGVATLRVMKAERCDALLTDLVWQSLDRLPVVTFEVLLRYILGTDLDGQALKNRLVELKSESLKNKAMSVAEQFKLEGRLEGRNEGREEGLLIGRIQALQDVLGQAVTSIEALSMHPLPELTTLYAELRRQLP